MKEKIFCNYSKQFFSYTLSKTNIADFDNNGYFVIPNLLPKKDLNDLRVIVDRVVSEKVKSIHKEIENKSNSIKRIEELTQEVKNGKYLFLMHEDYEPDLYKFYLED